MKQKIRMVIFILIFIFNGLNACSQADTPPATGELAIEGAVLELVGLIETKTLTMAELRELEPTEGWGGTLSSTGLVTPPQRLKGVTLTALSNLVGGLEMGMGVSIVARDGYGMTMSYEQITAGDFVTYDPGTGLENKVEGPLQVIIAYERDGEPISPDDDGPLRLFIVSPNNDNIIDGHWTVKWVRQIQIKPMSEEWSLNLEGALTEQIDRNSFESCSAPGCHQVSWEDDEGNLWNGIPLYYLAGRVDDGVIHEERAYNDEFAKAGYVLELFADDGYQVSISSDRTNFNPQILVVSSVNGTTLGEKHFPLRLVGDDLDKSEMIGALAQIVIAPADGVKMPSSEVEMVDELNNNQVLPEGAAVMVHGRVINQLTLGMENLLAMNVVDIQAEDPKNGIQTYQGVLLNDLLNLAGIKPGSTMILITASDGYLVEIDLAEVQSCQDCLLAIDEDNSLKLVMVGMESSTWVKDVSFIEIR